MLSIEGVWKVLLSMCMNSVLNLSAVLRRVWLTRIWLWPDDPYQFGPVKLKEFYCILDATENTRACCLGNHLGISLVHIGTFVKIHLWKIWGGCCVCVVQACVHAYVYPAVVGRLPSVVLTHSSFDIAYSYWYVMDMLKGAIWNRSPVSCSVLGVADAAGHPDVVFSDSYLTLCRSIENTSPQCESRRSRSTQAHWVTC